ncbi:MAG: extracellular solute-binding protein [Neoaquamicrobium sediminum]|jgi:spermidine/putrescine transport system substrate-binding protein|uniref:Extracellular solute-binding protein n=1 Tax=Neoaquamicrobium sediminum TaxID=1849104 RepID=A0ABV3WV75_9HYPH|nr:extracellular solute-binding protein [Mesorhizobium sediminum]MBX9453357.1 extracellular solute-binding protein [Mesorhizobium sp.]NRC56143.1 extracellular solute-binding protein [Mesorhizobium sediminum]
MAMFQRRTLLKGAASVAGLSLAAPFVSRKGFAQGSSGSVNVFAWAGYLNDEMLAAFEKSTGIKANYTPYGTNDELLNQLRANNGAGFDIIWPTVDRVPNYVEFELIQPLDEAKIEVAKCLPSAWENSAKFGAVVDGKRYQVPTDWGTEALAFDKEQAPLEYGTASYGDIWKEEMAGKATVRGHSSLVGLGLWLEAEGKLPRPLLDAFASPEAQVEIFDVILAEAIARKGNIVQFWSNENEAQGAFRVNGAAIGQTWDSTGAALAKEGLPVGFIAPKEGALAWMEGVSIPSGAENIDQAYAFINWFLTPEAGAMYSNATSINSTAVGAADLLSDEAKAFFAAAYPGDALDKLWWWPIQESWYVTKRNEYQDRFLSA